MRVKHATQSWCYSVWECPASAGAPQYLTLPINQPPDCASDRSPLLDYSAVAIVTGRRLNGRPLTSKPRLQMSCDVTASGSRDVTGHTRQRTSPPSALSSGSPFLGALKRRCIGTVLMCPMRRLFANVTQMRHRQRRVVMKSGVFLEAHWLKFL